MNRSAFYASVRQRASGVFGTSLSQAQVEGCKAILDEAERRGTSVFHLAAILSEVYHETGGQMQPVKETVYANSKDRNPTDAAVIKRLDTAFAKGQLTWVKKPYWREGWFGRGLIQITHEANYRKLGLSKDTALVLSSSVRATFDGMEQGLFTDRKLSDYDYLVTRNPDVPGFKYYASRAIVNGDTAGNGAMIATYAKAFETGLSRPSTSQSPLSLTKCLFATLKRLCVSSIPSNPKSPRSSRRARSRPAAGSPLSSPSSQPF
ncbi:hypothetical protein [Shinella sp.]|uniref:hypothetical protein n=1 Tax=Shinella sp. TaxID=1870904 RepID=UPI0040351514